MRIQKNVDIKDIDSILKQGILCLDDCQNNNWESGRRANNPTDVVYWAVPAKKGQSFVNYGLALVIADVEDVTESTLLTNDVNNGLYTEYTTQNVPACQIAEILIPDWAECDTKDSRIERVCVFGDRPDYDSDDAISAGETAQREFNEWHKANSTKWCWKLSTPVRRRVTKNIGDETLGFWGVPDTLLKECADRQIHAERARAEYAKAHATRIRITSNADARDCVALFYEGA